MTTVDHRTDTDIDVPLGPPPRTITVNNPHRAHVGIAGFTTIAVGFAPAVAMAQNSPNVSYTVTAAGVSILWFLYALARHNAYAKRPPTSVFRADQ